MKKSKQSYGAPVHPANAGKEIKGDFPPAEWNDIGGKCFTHTPLGPEYRSCDRKAGNCFCCVRHYLPSHPPTHPKISVL